jgi:hypothetical protein
MNTFNLYLNGSQWGHCYSFMAAYRWRMLQLDGGADPVSCYITKGQLPLRVPVYGPLQSA